MPAEARSRYFRVCAGATRFDSSAILRNRPTDDDLVVVDAESSLHAC